MGEVAIKLGPADQGRKMSLDEFEQADASEGYQYELSRGVVTVVDAPDRAHGDQIDEAQQQLRAYRVNNPRVIHRIYEGSSGKMVISAFESERHPDLLIYKAPPETEEQIWSIWVPEIVVEVVSPSSVYRDYEEKPEEYLRFGVREYWIIDRLRGQLTALRRRGGKWSEQVVRPPERYQTKLLPGFELDLEAIFRAAEGQS